MAINYQRTKQYLHEFQFQQLFIEELGWAHCRGNTIPIALEEGECLLSPFAQMGGMVIYQGKIAGNSKLPQAQRRISISREISKVTFEHMVIFTDTGNRESLWLWAKHEAGKPFAVKEHQYKKGMPGDSLLQKLAGIAFQIEDLDEEGKAAITDVKSKFQKQFDVEKVTKRFYDEFKVEHSSFAKFLKGIEVQDQVDWYISVMLNRLMFIYFIQKKGFLNGDVSYLDNKLGESKSKGANRFYRQFLMPLFFEGFAKEEDERGSEAKHLLGKIPYLNGGIFQRHKLEEENPNIEIPDAAFERLFAFFDKYQWHLDYRPLKADNEINPDVLGYIFEKYVNQEQMGAYYTREDITGYICKNTIIPFLFDKLEVMRYEELHPFPMKDVEPYIYGAVKQKAYLHTETEREYQARQKRYQQIKTDFAAGKITSINDLITYNLDIRKFAEDWARGITDPVTLRAFYFHCLTKVTILDPAVGSGAFLFAALNMLEPLYEICLDKMQEFGGPKYEDFAQELARVNQHPNREYFVFKSIIVNNLFGVDIMEEAVEICKLRLFLKLVAQIDNVDKIEPLPDIDFNIRIGNTLVGYASEEEIKKAKATQLDLGGALAGIEKRIEAAGRSLKIFRDLQTKLGIPAYELSKAKDEVKTKLAEIQNELDRDLFAFYGARDFEQFKKTHKPFHWFVEFYSIMHNGGFDIIIGNPPYVQWRNVNDYFPSGYLTTQCPDIYAACIERSMALVRSDGRYGMILPISFQFSDDFRIVRKVLMSRLPLIWVSAFSRNPAALFNAGLGVRSSICIAKGINNGRVHLFTTRLNRWVEESRPFLFESLQYAEVPISLQEVGWPRLGSERIAQLFLKLSSFGKKFEDDINNSGEYEIRFKTTALYYISAFVKDPPSYDKSGKPINQTKIGTLRYRSQEIRDICLVIALGKIALLWWAATGDDFDVTSSGLGKTPVSFSLLSDKVRHQLLKYSIQIQSALNKNVIYTLYAGKWMGNYDVKYIREITDKADQDILSLLGLEDYWPDLELEYDRFLKATGERPGTTREKPEFVN